MQCPRCNVALAMTDRQGVEIDYCPQCRGVWLDRGELDKIIDRAAGEFGQRAAPFPVEPPPPARPSPGYASPGYTPPYAHQDDRWAHKQQHQPYKKHKKSFLEDIFDF
jgi:Zn-finger nucleic acid-binding protein